MNYILSMKHQQATLENVGGKGMSLSKMLAAGLPVPERRSLFVLCRSANVLC